MAFYFIEMSEEGYVLTGTMYYALGKVFIKSNSGKDIVLLLLGKIYIPEKNSGIHSSIESEVWKSESFLDSHLIQSEGRRIRSNVYFKV